MSLARVLQQLTASLAIEGVSAEELREIESRRKSALASTGRVELDNSAMQMLGEALVAEFGCFDPDAVDVFYELRDDLPAHIPDAEIVAALVCAAKRTGGGVETLDTAELARQLLIEDDTMSHYSLVDDTGHAYVWDPRDWEYDEHSPGWNGELWGGDIDG